MRHANPLISPYPTTVSPEWINRLHIEQKSKPFNRILPSRFVIKCSDLEPGRIMHKIVFFLMGCIWPH